MIQAQEYVSWLGFPEVPSWAPFSPVLEVSPQPGIHMWARQQAVQSFQTGSLAQAVAFLATESIPLVYRALPQLPASPEGGVLVVTHELDWPILRPSNCRPKKIREHSGSTLWCKRRERFGYFTLKAAAPGQPMHLAVGGVSAEDCIRSWLTVSAWIRTLLRIQFPARRVPKEVVVPDGVLRMPGQTSRDRRRNKRIREVLLQAAEFEGKKAAFELSGRGHEPRVSLDVRLAAIVRGVELPSVYISGFGANNFYPLRVFKRAAAKLKREFGRPILVCNGYCAWVADSLERAR